MKLVFEKKHNPPEDLIARTSVGFFNLEHIEGSNNWDAWFYLNLENDIRTARVVIGIFTTREKAEKACQEYLDKFVKAVKEMED